MTAAPGHALVNAGQVGIPAHGYLAGLYQEEAQPARTLFADRSHAPPLVRPIFHRIEAGKGAHFSGGGKAVHTLEGVTHADAGQQTNPRMRLQSLYGRV